MRPIIGTPSETRWTAKIYLNKLSVRFLVPACLPAPGMGFPRVADRTAASAAVHVASHNSSRRETDWSNQANKSLYLQYLLPICKSVRLARGGWTIRCNFCRHLVHVLRSRCCRVNHHVWMIATVNFEPDVGLVFSPVTHGKVMASTFLGLAENLYGRIRSPGLLSMAAT